MNDQIFSWFNTPERLADVLVGSVVFFVFIVVLVRVLGKRITSQMNNFDWIITVAIGSLASSGILLKNVSIAEGTAAIAALAACQWLTTWAVMRFEWFAKLVKAKPRLLAHKGQLLNDAMRAERVSREEIFAKLREQGYVSVADANWVILETDGKMTVIPKQEAKLGNVELLDTVNCSAAPVDHATSQSNPAND